MRDARSIGNPYAPVLIAGNAIDRIVFVCFDPHTQTTYLDAAGLVEL